MKKSKVDMGIKDFVALHGKHGAQTSPIKRNGQGNEESLFDQYFLVRKMVTPHIIRAVCAVATVFCIIGAVYGLILLISGGPYSIERGGLVLLMSLASMVSIRVATEFVIVVFNIHDHAATLVEQGKSSQSTRSASQGAAE